MPFKSAAQRAYMYANHPDIAKRWSAEYPNQGKLPEHVKQKQHEAKKQILMKALRG